MQVFIGAGICGETSLRNPIEPGELTIEESAGGTIAYPNKPNVLNVGTVADWVDIP